MKKLTKHERRVRRTLMSVCRGELATLHARRINYKHLWELLGDRDPWTQKHTLPIVEWIVNISEHDREFDMPPLCALVVRVDTGLPGRRWSASKYKTAVAAQRACWAYWKPQ